MPQFSQTNYIQNLSLAGWTVEAESARDSAHGVYAEGDMLLDRNTQFVGAFADVFPVKQLVVAEDHEGGWVNDAVVSGRINSGLTPAAHLYYSLISSEKRSL